MSYSYSGIYGSYNEEAINFIAIDLAATSFDIVAGGGVINKLSPTDHHASYNIVDNVATLNTAGFWRSARAELGFSTGKWYWEATPVTSALNYAMLGVGTSTDNLATHCGVYPTEYAYYSSTGCSYTNNIATVYGATYNDGDIIGIALDMDTGTISFYKNGVSQGVAYTGLSGTLYPMCSLHNAIGDNWSFNFGDSDFFFDIPSGYNSPIYNVSYSSGSGTLTSKFCPLSSGSITTSSACTVTAIHIPIVVSTTMLLSGSGSAVYTIPITGSGLATITSTSSYDIHVKFIPSSSGSLALSGTAGQLKILHISGSGVTTLSGTGLATAVIYEVASGGIVIFASNTSYFYRVPRIGSGLATLSLGALVDPRLKVQIMHTDRTLYIEEDVREVFVDYDENRTIEIETEYRELNVPVEASYYVS